MLEGNNASQVQTHNINHARFKVIRLATILSYRIISDHPEVADDYRGGLKQREIVLRHNISDGNTVDVAILAVRKALEILIPDDERAELVRKNRSVAGQKNGNGTYKKKVGMYGKDVVGKNILAKGEVPWIVSLVDAETGLNEIDYLISLSKNSEFIHQKGSGKGHPDRKKIADKLNAIFHNGQIVRSAISIMTRLYELRKAGKIS